ncbi:MAG: hypothetical protein H0U15_02655 [Geodermatophilaceae bacterium]|nr:hypothetical protein [Geodermatophilaceae bacterium]
MSLSEYVLTELIQVAGRSTNAQILLRAALRPGSFSREEIEALDVPLVTTDARLGRAPGRRCAVEVFGQPSD